MSEENKALARRYIEQIWNERRLDLFEEFVAEDVALHSRPETMGRENVKERIVAIQNAFPDFHQTIEDDLAEGDKVVHRWTISRTHQGELLGIPATGKEIANSGMSIIRIADGKLVELWVESDNMTMMQQLGAIPTPGQG